MPIYEYQCEDCDHAFEKLVRSSTNPQCPQCESKNLEKMFSTFAAGASSGGGATDSMPECRTCGIPGGSCGLN